MLRLILAALLCAAPAYARTIDVAAGTDAQERLQNALIDAKPGDTVRLGAGSFALTDGLSLDVDRVTVRGAGSDRTILDFQGQLGSGEGLLVTSDGVVLRDFAVRDTKGDGIKSKGADRIVYKNIHVTWGDGPKETNGAYGIYPVASRFVLIDGCYVSGASDAGIYVGQSTDIVVRRSIAERNVAGIEIENSNRADVYENTARHNTGGILIFDLPNLPKMGGGQVHAFRNTIVDNDQANFAPKGNIVANVRVGTGMLIMANDGVQVTDNRFDGNATASVMVVSYRFPQADARYNPLPRNIYVIRNSYGRTGFAPQLPGGMQLLDMFGNSLPPVVWDGSGQDLHLLVDDSQILSLGLGQGAPMETARPTIIELANGTPPALLPPVRLPRAMLRAGR